MNLVLQQLAIPYIPVAASSVWGKDLHFEAGKNYHIQAVSGKGKSTLIHTLFGLQQKFTGRILIGDTNSSHFSLDEWCDLRASTLSIVFQDLKLFEDQTAYDNIDIKRSLTNFYPLKKIKEFADRLQLSHKLDSLVSTLSYGERQRVAIIRSLIQDFKFLLLDEPFSHLDEVNIAFAASLILEETKKRNATLIIADLETDERFPYHQKLIL